LQDSIGSFLSGKPARKGLVERLRRNSTGTGLVTAEELERIQSLD